MTLTCNRRAFLVGSAALCAAPLARAAWSPERPIELLVSFAPGGTADGLARLIAQKLAEKRKWNVVVLNRPGGGGVVLQRALKAARADGHTIGLCGSHELTYPASEPGEAPYAMKDFRFLASVADFPHCLVGRPKDRLETLEQWRAYAKAKGSLSIGFTPPYERALLRLGSELGINVVPVPFKGGAETLQQILAGNIDLGWSAGSHVPLEKAGTIKAYLALTPARLPDDPQVPTAREFGSSIAVESRFVVLGSSTLPADVATDIEKALQEVLNDPATRAAVTARHLIADPRTGKALADALNVEAENAKAMFR